MPTTWLDRESELPHQGYFVLLLVSIRLAPLLLLLRLLARPDTGQLGFVPRDTPLAVEVGIGHVLCHKWHIKHMSTAPVHGRGQVQVKIPIQE